MVLDRVDLAEGQAKQSISSLLAELGREGRRRLNDLVFNGDTAYNKSIRANLAGGRRTISILDHIL